MSSCKIQENAFKGLHGSWSESQKRQKLLIETHYDWWWLHSSNMIFNHQQKPPHKRYLPPLAAQSPFASNKISCPIYRGYNKQRCAEINKYLKEYLSVKGVNINNLRYADMVLQADSAEGVQKVYRHWYMNCCIYVTTRA